MQESIIKRKKQLSQNMVQLTLPRTFKTLENVSLSNILEEQVDQKYFLSQEAVNRMNLRWYSPTLSIQATGEEQIETNSKQQLDTLSSSLKETKEISKETTPSQLTEATQEE